jgi:ribosome biogenesis ATPase
MTPGYVGADLQALTAAAGVIAIKRLIQDLQLATLQTPYEEMQIDDTPRPPQSEPPRPISILHRFIKYDTETIPPEQLSTLSITYEDFVTAIPKIQPSAKREGFATVPDVTWDNVGALSDIREQLQLAIVQQIKYPELYAQVGITAPSGVLLWGPPGCGKTLLAKAVANESRANFISVKGPELLNKVIPHKRPG